MIRTLWKKGETIIFSLIYFQRNYGLGVKSLEKSRVLEFYELKNLKGMQRIVIKDYLFIYFYLSIYSNSVTPMIKIRIKYRVQFTGTKLSQIGG